MNNPSAPAYQVSDDQVGYCPIRSTVAWFKTAGQFDGDAQSVRQVAFYTGMQMEELAEKLAIFLGKTDECVLALERLGHRFKNGEYDTAVEYGLRTDPEGIFDGDLDLIWVSIGGAGAAGNDVYGGFRAVGKANWAKFPGGVVTRHPTTGKVIKPEGWRPPDLGPFLFHNRK